MCSGMTLVILACIELINILDCVRAAQVKLLELLIEVVLHWDVELSGIWH
jgi:hypothetical protein